MAAVTKAEGPYYTAPKLECKPELEAFSATFTVILPTGRCQTGNFQLVVEIISTTLSSSWHCQLDCQLEYLDFFVFQFAKYIICN